MNYTDLGAKTADLAYSAITDGMDGMEDYYLMDGGIITVNTDTAAAIGKQARVLLLRQHGHRRRGHDHQGLNRNITSPRMNCLSPDPPSEGQIGLKGEFPHAHHHADRP